MAAASPLHAYAARAYWALLALLGRKPAGGAEVAQALGCRQAAAKVALLLLHLLLVWLLLLLLLQHRQLRLKLAT